MARAPPRSPSMTRLQLNVLLWALVAVAGLGAGALYLRQGGAEGVGAVLGGPFEVIDHDGRTVTEADLEGSPTLLFFGFTHCPEICPTTVYEMAGWLDELGPQASDLKAYFATVDPERDTPEMLRDYLTSQTDDVVGLTGTPEQMAGLAKAWRAYYARVPLEGGDYTMDHFAGVYLIDENGDYAGLISYGEDHDTAVAKIRELL